MLRKALIPIFISVLGIFLTLGLLEICFRFMEKRMQPTQWSDRPTYYFQAEKSPTLQDYPYTAEKAPGTFRIAVVGDSFSFAPFMQFTDAFPKKLEQMLNLNDSSTKAQVINYGVPAYSTSHEVPKVAQAIKEQSDLIILQITLNDPEYKPITPIGITNFTNFGPMQPGASTQKLFAHWHTLAFVAQRLHNSQTYRDYINYFNNLYDNPKTWGPFKKAMGKIAKSCSKSNTRIVAVVFPLFGLPLDASYPFYPIHKKIDDLLTTLNVPHMDLSEYYKGIPLERLQVIPGIDRHPNEIGHRIAAERIYDYLAQNNFIPEELKIKLKFKGRTRIINEEAYIDQPKN